LLEPAALIASGPLVSRETLELAFADIQHAIADPDTIDADALQRLEIALHVDCLAHMPNRKLLGAIHHAHTPLTVNHAFYKAFSLHPDIGTLTEHRAVLEHLLAGRWEAAASALKTHLESGQKRTLQRLKVLAVLPEPALPGFMHRIA
jgi:DNA-binding GntR family transcriptional regulator